MKSIRDSKGIYWGLIITFFVLYALVGFVSTLHSITFFELANTMWMAVMLGITYEVGQAAVLFSILMTKNNQKLLPWALMILLTALQVTANVYASFKFMDGSGSTDWTYWQRSILFWMETDSPEMFKVVISWITGALLPIVALGMVALVAENLNLKDEDNLAIGGKISEPEDPEPDDEPEFDNKGNVVGAKVYDEPAQLNVKEKVEIDDTVKFPPKTEQLHSFAEELLDPRNQLKFPEGVKTPGTPGEVEVIKEPLEINLQSDKDVMGPDDSRFMMTTEIAADEFVEKAKENLKNSKPKIDRKFPSDYPKKPINNKRGWHLKKQFIDDNGDVYHHGIFQENIKSDPPKKA